MDDYQYGQDNMNQEQLYQLKQKMGKDDLLKFEQSRLNMEADDNEYMEQRNVNLKLKGHELQEKYFKRRNTKERFAPVKLDMPPQDAEEKESTRKKRIKRERKVMAKQAKALNKALSKELTQEPEQKFQKKKEEIMQTGKIDWEAEDLFSIRLQQELFSPKYAFEHYAELRQKLDNLNEKIAFFDDILNELAQGGGNEQEFIVPLEYRLRLELMKQMRDNAEEALGSALEARGYELRRNYQSWEYEIVEIENKNLTVSKQGDNLVARKKIRKLVKNMDEYVADQMIEESLKQLEPEFSQMRYTMQFHPKYSRIHAGHFTDEHQFDVIKEVKDLMEGHPGEYQANKEVIDKMYQEVYKLMNVQGTLHGSTRAISELENAKKVTSGKMQEVLNRRREVLDKKMNVIQSRANYIIEGMKHLLKGDGLSERARITMNEFIEQSEDDVINQRNAAKEKADIYASKLKDKMNIFVNLCRRELEGDYLTGEDRRYMVFMEPKNMTSNSNVMRLLQQKNELERNIERGREEDVESDTFYFEKERKLFIRPYMKKVQDIDINKLMHCTDEELLERMDELQEMSIQAEKMMEIVKNRDPEDMKGRSILETFCRNRKDRMMFSLKYSLIQSHALRARSLAMITAYEKDALTPSCLSGGDKEEVLRASDSKHTEKNGITRQQLLTYAKLTLRRSEAMKNAAYRRYNHNQI